MKLGSRQFKEEETKFQLVNTSLSETITKLKYDPYDIKPINHPIDYVVYWNE